MRTAVALVMVPACLLLADLALARRVEIRPRIAEAQLYYEDEADAGLGGESEDYASAPVYQPRTRALPPSTRSKDTISASKPPPVQTIRNYNKVNDDGSFTFGYEAADGSFKEETRGTDCVVRGKYGYIDPDGNKREFTYVSGNPCDPNAPKDADDDEPLPGSGSATRNKDDEDSSAPANYPSVRPVQVARPLRPSYSTTTPKAPVTVFQSEYQLADDDASQELEEEPVVRLRPSAFRRPASYEPITPTQGTLYRLAQTATSPRYQSPTSPQPLRTQPTVSTTYYAPLESSTRAAPVTRSRAPPQSVAITPRPHIAQVAAQYVSPSPSPSTERPGLIYTPRTVTQSQLLAQHSTSTATPPSQHLDFVAELERYVNSVGSSSSSSTTPRPQGLKQSSTSSAPSKADPIYQSELVYDPSTGQYNTQLYQSLPQTLGDFSLSHKLQPYVAQHHQHQQPLLSLQQSPIYRQSAGQPTPVTQVPQKVSQPQEAIYKKQQQQLLQQSQQLYAQQQRRQQQQQQQQQPQRVQLLAPGGHARDSQQFYYITSQNGRSGPLSAGQIDQFLRGNANAF